MTVESRYRIGIVALALGLVAAVPYARTASYPFVLLDDPAYLFEDPHVGGGLTWGGVCWAFTTFHASNWHPLTWLSHMLDVSLFGMSPGAHHLVNVFLHCLNASLLFLALFRMTGALWRSAMVAALFGVHPLHVESVVWVAERKDVLSGMFFMLTLWSYVRYVESPGPWRYLRVAGFLALGLMSKPMLVTVPFLLLLLDFWPLGRTGFVPAASGEARTAAPPWELLREKAPLFLLSAASCVVTYVAQAGGGAIVEPAVIPLSARLGNAVVSYLAYVAKTVWPSGLAVLYPHAGDALSLGKVAGASLLVGGATFFAGGCGKRLPYFPAGWFWFLGTLVPVIGIVQVGEQAMADRYAYLPLAGLFVTGVWGAFDVACRWRLKRCVLAASSIAILAAFGAASYVQAGWWRDSVALFTRTLEAGGDHWLVRNNLGYALADTGRHEDAIVQYRAALRIRPAFPEALNNLGMALARTGRTKEAIECYRGALEIRQGYAEPRNNLGLALAEEGRIEEAVHEYREVLRVTPDFVEARNNLGVALLGLGRVDEAIAQFREAVNRRPEYELASRNLALVLEMRRSGRATDAEPRKR